ncbi:hypothetical protein QN224_32340 [Sinorhizobium sp. 8-89]|uniref:hypothetical protein n=1 Tax=Sinorhizobium sp. 7-81 TaxID=3049087 RepID=UPI0024C45657|nr:hypothetical protein [Sinorhizobium sp. 7-81]MDK1390010.1 hypothetical protein [Sinorhizobium sp. 7-81]
MTLDDLNDAQSQRVIFLDRCLIWRGSARRRDLMERFKISSAQAALDFRAYLQIAAVPPEYDPVRKAYVASAGHRPLLSPNLTSDFEVLADAQEGLSSAVVPAPNRWAEPSIIVRLYEAMKASRAIHICYTSMTTGADAGQWLAPVRFTSDGENVHLRAFSFKHQSYRDYLPVRVDERSSFETRELLNPLPVDVDWQTRAVIWLRPKVGLSGEQAAVVRKEYGFNGEALRVATRKALEFYLLRRWRIGEENSRLEVQKISYEDWERSNGVEN